jgi:hypothetical protein
VITEIKKNILYRAFGLNVYSEVPLPELQEINPEIKAADVIIGYADLNKLWLEKAEKEEQYFVIEETSILFRMPNVAIFLIRNGNEILVTPTDGVKEDYIRLYVLGTCMGAILMQRKILPLHGSAIAINGKAYAIVGDSGAGKSTLASAFINKGYSLLSDDVIPVTLNEDHTPIVTPAYPQQKLWLESINHFGMDSEGYRRIIDRETKFAIPVSTDFANQSMPLAGVIELVKTENEEIEITPIQSLERLHTLFTHTYRNFFINPAGLMEWHFSTTAKMVNQIDLFRLSRPISRFTAHDLTELIVTKVVQEEIVK